MNHPSVSAQRAERGAPALQARRLSRRSFFKLTGMAGGGLMLGFHMPLSWAEKGSADQAGFAPNVYLRISTEGIVIHATQPELGQGIKTATPMIIAEELDAAWEDVQVRQSWISEQDFGRQFAGGSTSVARVWQPMRRAGAVARSMLVSAAAQLWIVPEGECTTERSHVLHPASGRKASYLELAAIAARLPVPDPADVRLKERSEWRLLGTRVTGVDNRALVLGESIFGIDQQLPGLLHAAYVKCPRAGGRVIRANLEEILALPGIERAFVFEGNGDPTELRPGVAIVGRDTWAVLKARQALRVEWDLAAAADDDWERSKRAALEAVGKTAETTVAEHGDLDTALAGAAATVESLYSYAFVSHAQLEPLNCTAWYHADSGIMELWAPTQMPQRAVSSVAGLLGSDEASITLHQLRMGGGFGRRVMNDAVCEAAAIARRLEAPVKLQWTREDDMTNDFLRAGGFHALKGGVDAAGRALAWRNHFITFTADGSRPVIGGDLRAREDLAHLFPNFRLERSQLPWSSPCGYWRAPGANVFAFALQSFLHELSVAAGRDHLEFLLELLGEPRWLEPQTVVALHTGRAADVLRLAAEKAGWGRTLPEGRALGIAFYFSHAAHVAEVAEVSVDADRRIRVHEVTVACDVGPIVNLAGAEHMSEGSVIDGISAMAGQKLTHEGGRVRETNFDRYPLLRMADAPRVKTYFIQSDFPPTGLGEPVLPPVAPAICNAVYSACGHRIRSLPISEEGFRI